MSHSQRGPPWETPCGRPSPSLGRSRRMGKRTLMLYFLALSTTALTTLLIWAHTLKLHHSSYGQGRQRQFATWDVTTTTTRQEHLRLLTLDDSEDLGFWNPRKSDLGRTGWRSKGQSRGTSHDRDAHHTIHTPSVADKASGENYVTFPGWRSLPALAPLPATPLDWPSTTASVASVTQSTVPLQGAHRDVYVGFFNASLDLSPRCLHSGVCDHAMLPEECGRDGLACIRDASARQGYIKEAMQSSWNAYRRSAWGHDEVRHTAHGDSSFDWLWMGLSILDSLDTLWIMNMTKEYQAARDWAVHKLELDSIPKTSSVFEVTIRIIGGLLSAFTLSGGTDMGLLTQAQRVGDRLMEAFDTHTGVPHVVYDLSGRRFNHKDKVGRTNLADAGSTIMEMVTLSRLTGDPRYADATTRFWRGLSHLPSCDGLYCMWFDAETMSCLGTREVGLGASADSFYEYMLKQWIMTGGRDTVMLSHYHAAMKGMRAHLVLELTPQPCAAMMHGSVADVALETAKDPTFARAVRAMSVTAADQGAYPACAWDASMWMVGSGTQDVNGQGKCEAGSEGVGGTMGSRIQTLGEGVELQAHTQVPTSHGQIVASGKTDIWKKRFGVQRRALLSADDGDGEARLMELAARVDEGEMVGRSVRGNEWMHQKQGVQRTRAQASLGTREVVPQANSHFWSRTLEALGQSWPPTGTSVPQGTLHSSTVPQSEKANAVDQATRHRRLSAGRLGGTFKDVQGPKGASMGVQGAAGGSKGAAPLDRPTPTLWDSLLHSFRAQGPQEPEPAAILPLRRLQHFTCFVPGLLVLGHLYGVNTSRSEALHAGLVHRSQHRTPPPAFHPLKPTSPGPKIWRPAEAQTDDDLLLAMKLMRGCYELYRNSETGVAGDVVDWVDMDPVQSQGERLPFQEPVYRDAKNYLRPEVVESLFYLWRATHHQVYRDWGWQIFRSFHQYSRLKRGGYSTLEAATETNLWRMGDRQESFWMAETLKYLFLLFSDDPELLPLDQWVFNTEAHPLPMWGSRADQSVLRASGIKPLDL